MSGAVAEKISYYPQLVEAQEQPMVKVVPEMSEDETITSKAHQFLRLGSLVLAPALEQELDQKAPIESLKDAIHLAASNDERGKKVLEANVSTDVIERTMKVKHVMSIGLEVDDNGEIHQHGQSMKNVQLNSWKYAAQRWQMKDRVVAENRNAFRLQHNYNQGALQDYSFVEISMAADNMSKESMDKVGFFTETMSCVIRTTTMKDGVLTVLSAFVAGVKEPDSKRHDHSAVQGMGQVLGVDYEGKTAAEILDTPVLIHNSRLPNGVIDLVKLYDECAGGTFFGEAKPQGNYQEVIAESKRREKSFEAKVNAITSDLIDRAASINTPAEASLLLNKLSGKHMLEQAVQDSTINARVFGPEAAEYIERSRHHFALGNHELAYAAMNRAKKVETSGSCPGGAEETEVDSFGNPIDSSNNFEKYSTGRDRYGSLKFKCQNGHPNTRPRNELIDRCKTCGVNVKC